MNNFCNVDLWGYVFIKTQHWFKKARPLGLHWHLSNLPLMKKTAIIVLLFLPLSSPVFPFTLFIFYILLWITSTTYDEIEIHYFTLFKTTSVFEIVIFLFAMRFNLNLTCWILEWTTIWTCLKCGSFQARFHPDLVGFLVQNWN